MAPWRPTVAYLAVLVLTATRASEQVPKCPNAGRAVAQPCELDQWPLPITSDNRPRYPDIMRQAGVAGEVLVRYVIDTSGIVIRDSLIMIRSTHALFTTAVKNAVPLLRFEPPRRDGMPVKVAVEELVTFDHAGSDSPAINPVQHTRRTADSTGRYVTIVYALLPRDSTNAPLLTKTDSLEIYDVVVEQLMRSADAKDRPAAWCVHLGSQVPAAELFARWRRGGRRVVAIADCPRSYDSMVYSPSAPKPPPGWIDPVAIGVHTTVSWAADIVVLTAQTFQGSSGTAYKCEVGREAGKWVNVSCMPTARILS